MSEWSEPLLTLKYSKKSIVLHLYQVQIEITYFLRFYRLRIFCSSDFYEPDPNTLSCITLVNFESESITKNQSVVVASGPHEACVMRSAALAPAFIQLESEDKVTGVESVAGFWSHWISCYRRYTDAGHTFHPVTGGMASIISPGSLSVLITLTKTNHTPIAAQVFVHVTLFGSNSV